jgi:alanine racemase
MPHNSPRRRAFDAPIRPTRAEVSLSALAENLHAARSLAPQAEVLAVVKANAYGHGAVPVARQLERKGVGFLGVALVEEGMELRNAGIKAPILVMGGSYDGGYDAMVAHRLVPTVFRAEHLHQLSVAASRAGQTVKAHLKVDTGMGRIGVSLEDLGGFLDGAARYVNVQIDGVLSHFANADLKDGATTRTQVQRFRHTLKVLRAYGVEPQWRHLSNSAGVISLPEVRDGAELNLVRPGLMLYGVAPAPWLSSQARLAPVLSWKTAVVHLKRVPAGTPVSYGGTWVATREAVIATLPVGYADGYSRQYSNRAEVLVRGQRAKIAGRVCMDMCMVDVTDIPDVQVGDEVVLLGAQGREAITADELAKLADTISYEVLCAVSSRVPRVAIPERS